MSDCIFCKIAAGGIPAKIAYEDDLVLAFHDIDPKAPTHILIIPKEHIVSAADINAENSAAAAKCLEAAAKLAAELGLADGFRLVSNCGDSAGQSVKHLHFHLLAGRDFMWPPG
ncbi:MAG: HIT domain-containing protein [Oscillospiraceae bacterium]|nr:HIT domain-containing protein [Oscillospiraceae bacterium]